MRRDVRSSGWMDGLIDRWIGGWAEMGGQALGFTVCECTSVDCRSDGPVCCWLDSDSVVMTQGRQC